MAVSSEGEHISDFAVRDAVVKSRAVAEMLSVTRLHTETDLSLSLLSNGSGILTPRKEGPRLCPAHILKATYHMRLRQARPREENKMFQDYLRTHVCMEVCNDKIGS